MWEPSFLLNSESSLPDSVVDFSIKSSLHIVKYKNRTFLAICKFQSIFSNMFEMFKKCGIMSMQNQTCWRKLYEIPRTQICLS